MITIGKNNPKHNSRKFQSKKRHFIKNSKSDTLYNQNYPNNKEMTDDLDGIDPKFILNKMTNLMRTTRGHSFTLALIYWFFESIKDIDPNFSQKTQLNLNQQQFGEFLTNFSNKLNSALIYQLKDTPAEMDYILHKFYDDYHLLKMRSIEREPFYFGLEYLLFHYKMISKNYKSSLEKAKRMFGDKNCVKNFFSFQNFCYANAEIQRFRIIIDMIDYVELPCTRIDENQELNPKFFFNSYFPKGIWKIKSEIYDDYKIYSHRLRLIGVPVWNSATFFERIYSNMVLAPMDPKMKNVELIHMDITYNYFKSIEKILIKELNFTALEMTSIITAFFNVFNEIHKNKEKKNSPGLSYFVFPYHSNQSNAVVRYVKDIYNISFEYKRNLAELITESESRKKIMKFLKLFSLNSSMINLKQDLFSHKKIPFVLSFHPDQYFISSIQFLTAFGEFLYRYGKKSGKYTNYKGKDFEQWVKNMLDPVVPFVCTRIQIQNVSIGNKNQTDIDVAIKYQEFLFVLECKAYSRINYMKSYKLDEIWKNMNELEQNLFDIDSVADWCQYPENLGIIIRKMNLKLGGNQRIDKSSIKYIVPVLATISPEFLLNNKSIGMLDSELNIPRCCTLREIIRIFEKLNENSSFKQRIKNFPYTVRVQNHF